MTATTAVTVQNTRGVQAVHHVPASIVKQQIHAVLDDMGVDVVKIGMLDSLETVRTVDACLCAFGLKMVVDPVMVSTSGAQLLPDECTPALFELFRQATIITPNVPEAQRLLKSRGLHPPLIDGLQDLITLAAKLQREAHVAVLLKGGHNPMAPADGQGDGLVVYDVLVERQTHVFESAHIESRNTHGTGCSLACEFSVLDPVSLG